MIVDTKKTYVPFGLSYIACAQHMYIIPDSIVDNIGRAYPIT